MAAVPAAVSDSASRRAAPAGPVPVPAPPERAARARPARAPDARSASARLAARPAARTRVPPAGWAALAAAGQGAAVALMAYAHVAGSGQVSMVSGLVSDYALTGAGAGPYALSLLALAAGVAALAAGLRRHRAGRAGPALLGLSSLAVLVAAVFPTDAGQAASLSGHVHRYATAAALAGIPAAGWVLTGGRAPRPGRPYGPAAPGRRRGDILAARITLGCWLSLGAFLVSHIPVSFPGTRLAGLLGDRVLYGLTERVVLLFEVALLLTLTAALGMGEPGRAAPSGPRRS